jgi:glutathione synthase
MVIRASLDDIEDQGVISQSGELFYQGHEIAIAYFRSGYIPEQYPTEKHWKGREKIELSKAIKCPDINFHIAGCKKIQQRLAQDLNLFTEHSSEILENITEIYDFSTISDELAEKVTKNTKDWVLKPQREGGGNNTYGDDILPFINNRSQHQEFILMKMIHCKESQCLMVRKGVLNKTSAVSELGLFGAIVTHNDEIVMNEYSGYLVRTKSKESNEGGVAAGYAVIDSAALVE